MIHSCWAPIVTASVRLETLSFVTIDSMLRNTQAPCDRKTSISLEVDA
ncbi:hypothetical protein IQ230_10895 [Gloeocapsopsis crepidinum LEGE 06123]|uniref:Uncharacterized protein n=1 Tax=Gloeocapsopsis crepidinum LEGE 06123 TaxID=588587 RepID=A0ABR9URD5_9CHRO|nr:hypothetical protein [Gloeocapsopsis crepidinum]MBE9190852.1 hypothetical protein [Gloeocapsopsis crepidinum LEGE 06123]